MWFTAEQAHLAVPFLERGLRSMVPLEVLHRHEGSVSLLVQSSPNARWRKTANAITRGDLAIAAQ